MSIFGLIVVLFIVVPRLPHQSHSINYVFECRSSWLLCPYKFLTHYTPPASRLIVVWFLCDFVGFLTLDLSTRISTSTHCPPLMFRGLCNGD